jgi:hypothetical protein
VRVVDIEQFKGISHWHRCRTINYLSFLSASRL